MLRRRGEREEADADRSGAPTPAAAVGRAPPVSTAERARLDRPPRCARSGGLSPARDRSMGGCSGDHGVGRAAAGRPRVDGRAGGRADRAARRGDRDPLHAARPRRRAGRRGAHRAGPPARRLPAPPAAPARRPAAHRGRRIDRRRQVDRGQQPGPGPGQPGRGAAPDHPLARCWSAIPTTCTGSPTTGCCPSWPGPAARGADQQTLQLVSSAAMDPGWPSWTRRTSTRWSTRTAGWPASCSPRPTCGCSSPPPPATPTRCRGSCCRPPQSRGTALAVLLDRVPPGAEQEVGPHLQEMLRRTGSARLRCS